MSMRVASTVQRSFRVMGCAAHVEITDGTEAMLDHAESRLRELESLWSRFILDSDISRANRAAGTPVDVAAETVAVVRRAIEAWKQTHGAFDITVLPALLHHGYTHSASAGQPAPRVSRRVIGVSGAISADVIAGTLTVPAGAAIDLGGIGKGYAADMVTEELLGLGAAGALVNIGGDIAVRGDSPTPSGSWVLGIEDPLTAPGHTAIVSIRSGGIATSGTTVRRWSTSSGETAHHLIDPRTARPAATCLLTATVIASDAATAESFATAAMMKDGRSAIQLLDLVGLAGLAVADDGTVFRTASLEAFLR